MKLCRTMGIRQSMGRVGSCFDNAATEAFFSSLEREVLSRHRFLDTRQAQAVVLEWCHGFHNHTRRHSSADMTAPITYETTALNREAAHRETLHGSGLNVTPCPVTDHAGRSGDTSHQERPPGRRSPPVQVRVVD